MDTLEGIWRLVDSRALDVQTQRLSVPYRSKTIGQMSFSQGRMLAALCSIDSAAASGAAPTFLAYGGPYTFDGTKLECVVDSSSDTGRIGDSQVRDAVLLEEHQLLVRPPPRVYGSRLEKHELVWERVWRPAEGLVV